MAKRTIATRGFTLTELLVAVAVVAILTLGIGQIFASISKLVGTGSAVAEVDQLSRTIEVRLRDDFKALDRMAEDETFLAIRNRRVGDMDDSKSVNGNERPLFLSSEDEEADLRGNFDPYEINADDVPLSSAVTVRLDEIMFIGQQGVGYESFQGGDARDTATHAIISYGHGMRPPIDIDETDSGGDPPLRLNYADGDFGTVAYLDNNAYAPSGSPTGNLATGRNQYAGDFVMTRHALLLFGGRASGPAEGDAVSSAQLPPPMLGEETEFAVFPRDLEIEERGPWSGVGAADVHETWPEGGPKFFNGRAASKTANPRLVRHGRTDVCAMSLEGLRRWLEGAPPVTNVFDLEKPFDDGAVSDWGAVNQPLWLVGVLSGTGPLDLALYRNLRKSQSSIAGMFNRKLVETETPELRFDPDEFNFTPRPQPRDARMDLHAVLADHCSRFEVAWSDGSTWIGPELEINTRGTPASEPERILRPGDVIWFDMDCTFFDFYDEASGVLTAQQLAQYQRQNPDPEIGLTPERHFDKMPHGLARGRQHENAVLVGEAVVFPALSPATIPNYSMLYTGGALRPNGDAAPEDEYMAIWGFRIPEGADQGDNVTSVGPADEASPAWPKPRMIRIRMTLHDSQQRIEKEFEYIFRIGLE